MSCRCRMLEERFRPCFFCKFSGAPKTACGRCGQQVARLNDALRTSTGDQICMNRYRSHLESM